MAILFKSMKSILASNSKKAFILSLLAVACWTAAITTAIFSDSLDLEYGQLIITSLLVVSAFFSINAIPRTTAGKLSLQPVKVEKGHPEH